MNGGIFQYYGDGVIPMPSDKITYFQSPIFNIHFWLSISKIILYDQRIYCEYLFWGQGISVFFSQFKKQGTPALSTVQNWVLSSRIIRIEERFTL